jgi:Fe-S-cluster containining protein
MPTCNPPSTPASPGVTPPADAAASKSSATVCSSPPPNSAPSSTLSSNFPHHIPQLTPAGCIYQIDNLCSVHAIRPFGCRIFFCDPAADDWQSAQYELFHARIKHIHHEFAIPYHYMEWRSALQSLRASEA